MTEDVGGGSRRRNAIYPLRRDQLISPVELTDDEQEIFDKTIAMRDIWTAPDLDLLASYAKAVMRLRRLERMDPPPSGRTFNEYIVAVRYLSDMLSITAKSRADGGRDPQKGARPDTDSANGEAPSGSFVAPWHQPGARHHGNRPS
jgi:hypothetical protein